MSTPVNTEKAGGTRFSAGKPSMWWAVPLGGLSLVAEVTMYGARKYAPQDWRSGQSFSTLLDCAFRHILAVMTKGVWSRDHESGLYHVGHALWNLLALAHFMVQGRKDLDDVTPWEGITTARKNALGLALDSDVEDLWDAHQALGEGEF